LFDLMQALAVIKEGGVDERSLRRIASFVGRQLEWLYLGRRFNVPHQHAIYLCRCDVFRCAQTVLGTDARSSLTVSFDTPLLLCDFKQVMLSEDSCGFAPVGKDFFEASSDEGVSREDLLRRFVLLESCGMSLMDLPVQDCDVAALWLELCQSAGSLAESLDTEKLVSWLEELHWQAQEFGNNWVMRFAMRRTSATFNAQALVDKFVSFVSSEGLSDAIARQRPKRVLTLCLWFSHLQDPQTQRRWAPGSPQCAIWVQSRKKQPYHCASDVFTGQSVHCLQDADQPFAPAPGQQSRVMGNF